MKYLSFNRYTDSLGRECLSFETPGCGCCGDSEATTNPDRAIELLTDYIAELESEVRDAYALRDRIKETREIPKEE